MSQVQAASAAMIPGSATALSSPTSGSIAPKANGAAANNNNNNQVSCSSQQNEHQQKVQHKSNSEQQSRCYLCETPKAEYSLVRAFSEPVCRGCVNFEGPDKVEQLIAAARRFKLPQVLPASPEPQVVALQISNFSSGTSNNTNQMQIPEMPDPKHQVVIVGENENFTSKSRELSSRSKESERLMSENLSIQDDRHHHNRTSNGLASANRRIEDEIYNFRNVDTPVPIQSPSPIKQVDLPPLKTEPTKSTTTTTTATTSEPKQQVGNYSGTPVSVTETQTPVAQSTSTTSASIASSMRHTTATNHASMTSTPTVSLPAVMSEAARNYYMSRNQTLMHPPLTSSLPPMKQAPSQAATAAAVVAAAAAAYGSHPFPPNPYNPYILRQMHDSLQRASASLYVDPMVTQMPNGDPYLNNRRYIAQQQQQQQQAAQYNNTANIRHSTAYGMGMDSSGQHQNPSASIPGLHSPYVSPRTPLLLPPPPLPPHQQLNPRQPQQQVGPLPPDPPPPHLVGGGPMQMSYWNQYMARMCHAQQQLAPSATTTPNTNTVPTTPDTSHSESNSPNGMQHQRRRLSPSSSNLPPDYPSLDPYQIQRVAVAYHHHQQQQQQVAPAAGTASGGMPSQVYGLPATGGPSLYHMSRLKSHLIEGGQQQSTATNNNSNTSQQHHHHHHHQQPPQQQQQRQQQQQQQQQEQQQQEQQQEQRQQTPSEMPHMSPASIRRMLSSSNNDMTTATTSGSSYLSEKSLISSAHIPAQRPTVTPPQTPSNATMMSFRQESNDSPQVIGEKLADSQMKRRFHSGQQPQQPIPDKPHQKRAYRMRGSSPPPPAGMQHGDSNEFGTRNSKRLAYNENNQASLAPPPPPPAEPYKKDKILKSLMSKRTYNKKIAFLKANERLVNQPAQVDSTPFDPYARRHASSATGTSSASRSTSASHTNSVTTHSPYCPLSSSSPTSSSSSSSSSSVSSDPKAMCLSRPQPLPANNQHQQQNQSQAMGHQQICSSYYPAPPQHHTSESASNKPPVPGPPPPPQRPVSSPPTKKSRQVPLAPPPPPPPPPPPISSSGQQNQQRSRTGEPNTNPSPAGGNGVGEITIENLNLRCKACEQRLDDKHFVQCPSATEHKYCFFCSRKSIERQRIELKEQKKDSDKVFCPSGLKCDLPSEASPWTFMTNEIETIFRDTEEQAREEREALAAAVTEEVARCGKYLNYNGNNRSSSVSPGYRSRRSVSHSEKPF